MAKTPKYPNPAFFRTKNNMDWKAQGENLKEVFDLSLIHISEPTRP